MPQIDLSGKAFYFHETSSSNYVKLIPDKEEAVSAATICLRYHSTLTTDQCLFSFATPSKDNTFLLFKFGYGKHTMAVNNDQPELLMSDERTPSGWTRVRDLGDKQWEGSAVDQRERQRDEGGKERNVS
ncbi:UNVERIFIED_CONTAM: hypothetical protein FKN15_061608 [Acipenser sinensis]